MSADGRSLRKHPDSAGAITGSTKRRMCVMTPDARHRAALHRRDQRNPNDHNRFPRRATGVAAFRRHRMNLLIEDLARDRIREMQRDGERARQIRRARQARRAAKAQRG